MIMEETKIDYNLVAQSSRNIKNAATEAKNTSGVNGELSNLIDQIVREGSDHDDCLSPYDSDLDDIVLDLKGSISKMDNLSSFCMVAFDAFLNAESNITDGIGTITINGIEFSNLKINSTGMKEYVNSSLNPNDLAGSINPNNLDNPLDPEELKRYELIFNKAMNEATTKKEKAALAAIFLTSVYPHMPYDWAGGHYASDLNYEGSINPRLGETYNGLHCGFQEDERLRTYDCSGFTSWVLKEAGYPEYVWSYEENGDRYANDVNGLVANSQNTQAFGNNYDINNCSVGDIAYMDDADDVATTAFPGDHIGVVVDKEGDTITVAHVSAGVGDGSKQADSAGFGYTKIDTKTGLVIDDSTSKRDNRVGKEYFTYTANYNDE